MKSSRLFGVLALLVISAVLSVGILGAMPHLHPDVGGQEQEGCTPCLLHQAFQPLAESSSPAVFQAFLAGSLILSAGLPVPSQSATRWFHSRAPPSLSL